MAFHSFYARAYCGVCGTVRVNRGEVSVRLGSLTCAVVSIFGSTLVSCVTHAIQTACAANVLMT